MKRFNIEIQDRPSTNVHRWVPDPMRRNKAHKSKKLYNRKGRSAKAGPSDFLPTARRRMIAMPVYAR